MNTSKTVRALSVAALAFGALFIPSLAQAQQTGNINVHGSIGLSCTITVTDDNVNLNLAVSTAGLGTKIGSILQNCNKLAGYDLTVSSANCTTGTPGAKMIGAAPVNPENLPYSVSFFNPTTGSSTANVTGLLGGACTGPLIIEGRTVTNAKINNETSNVYASYTANGSLSADSYSDVLTITMTVN